MIIIQLIIAAVGVALMPYHLIRQLVPKYFVRMASSSNSAGVHSMIFITAPNEEVAKKIAQ